MEIWSYILGGGIVPALIAAVVVVIGRGSDRIQVQKLGRLDRSFDIKLARYTDYLDAVESLLRAVYEFVERGIDPRSEGRDVDSIPSDIMQAYRALLVFAPDDIRKAIEAQFKLMAAAMESPESDVAPFQKSQDDLIAMMKKDLDLLDSNNRRLSRG